MNLGFSFLLWFVGSVRVADVFMDDDLSFFQVEKKPLPDSDAPKAPEVAQDANGSTSKGE